MQEPAAQARIVQGDTQMQPHKQIDNYLPLASPQRRSHAISMDQKY